MGGRLMGGWNGYEQTKCNQACGRFNDVALSVFTRYFSGYRLIWRDGLHFEACPAINEASLFK
jgi:hypothetical protein